MSSPSAQNAILHQFSNVHSALFQLEVPPCQEWLHGHSICPAALTLPDSLPCLIILVLILLISQQTGRIAIFELLRRRPWLRETLQIFQTIALSVGKVVLIEMLPGISCSREKSFLKVERQKSSHRVVFLFSDTLPSFIFFRQSEDRHVAMTRIKPSFR